MASEYFTSLGKGYEKGIIPNTSVLLEMDFTGPESAQVGLGS
jgi:hypothetical protein